MNKTIEEKKEFALAQIAPYYKDPTTCGFNGDRCLYLTEDGKMCVLGKNLIDPSLYGAMNGDDLLIKHGEDALKPESRGFLTPKEWNKLQNIHDNIAFKTKDTVIFIQRLGLFTLKELEEYAANLD